MTTPKDHNPEPKRPTLTLVTGGVGTGKTTRLLQYASDCRADGLRVRGVIARRTRDGYEFVDVNCGSVRPYATRNNNRDGHGSYPRFRFDAEAFLWVGTVLWSAVEAHCEVIVFDEYGPLERDGGGAFGALKATVAQFSGRLAVAVRRSLVEHVPLALGIPSDAVETIDVEAR